MVLVAFLEKTLSHKNFFHQFLGLVLLLPQNITVWSPKLTLHGDIFTQQQMDSSEFKKADFSLVNLCVAAMTQGYNIVHVRCSGVLMVYDMVSFYFFSRTAYLAYI